MLVSAQMLAIVASESDTKCHDICERWTCKEIIQKNCPDMFFIPAVPVLFGHIYLAYTKEDILNTTRLWHKPQYVCYNEEFCEGFYPNRTLFSFNNVTCRRPEDFPIYFRPALGRTSWIRSLIIPLYKQLYKCNTIIRNDPTFCDSSTMYQCVNSSKCISNTHLYDGAAMTAIIMMMNRSFRP
jgi:hypothetical protein